MGRPPWRKRARAPAAPSGASSQSRFARPRGSGRTVWEPRSFTGTTSSGWRPTSTRCSSEAPHRAWASTPTSCPTRRRLVDASTVTVHFRLDPGDDAPAAARGPRDVGSLQIAIRPRELLVVPSSAVLYSAQGPYVLAASPEDATFTKRLVEIGRILDSGYVGERAGEGCGAIVILSGLREGDRVITANTFFVDAERRLQAARGKGEEVTAMISRLVEWCTRHCGIVLAVALVLAHGGRGLSPRALARRRAGSVGPSDRAGRGLDGAPVDGGRDAGESGADRRAPLGPRLDGDPRLVDVRHGLRGRDLRIVGGPRAPPAGDHPARRGLPREPAAERPRSRSGPPRPARAGSSSTPS